MNRFTLHSYLDTRQAALHGDPRGAWVRFNEAWPLIAEAQDKLHKARVYSADLQRQLAEREAELAALVHPFDLEEYRSSK